MANEITHICAPQIGALIGRLQPAGWTAPDGSHVLVLGADRDDYVVDTWPAHRIGINGVYPTGFAGGETLQIAVGIGSTQTITFTADDQTLAQVIDRINATLTDAEASDLNDELKLESDARGYDARIEVVGGTGMVTLGHIAATGVGYGGVRVGDFFGWAAAVDFTGINLITFAMKMRQPSNSDIRFKASIEIAGAERMSVIPTSGTSVDFVTRHVNVADITGSQAMTLKLEAVPV